MDLTSIEKAVMPVAAPLVLNLWNSSVLPFLQAEAAKAGSDELKILTNAGVAFLDQVVKAELAKLQTI